MDGEIDFWRKRRRVLPPIWDEEGIIRGERLARQYRSVLSLYGSDNKTERSLKFYKKYRKAQHELLRREHEDLNGRTITTKADDSSMEERNKTSSEDRNTDKNKFLGSNNVDEKVPGKSEEKVPAELPSLNIDEAKDLSRNLTVDPTMLMKIKKERKRIARRKHNTHGACKETSLQFDFLQIVPRGCKMMTQEKGVEIVHEWEKYTEKVRTGCTCAINKVSRLVQSFFPQFGR
ncbi:hypothetical protein FSP39_022685 [Pinctada imbricata]|uniref:Uncharacterized protein n=1 Tax=Pinctada imbricata TaxID=66713 RepID=A0AA89C1Z6_PINIB|nr:hypothetical protein FSP39_022685 [Pinctada imbricata]